MIHDFVKYIRDEKRYSPNTIQSYEHDLNSFEKFVKEYYSLSILDVKHKNIRSWIVFLKENNFTNRSINRKITTLRSFFRFEILRGNLDENPAKRVQLLKQEINVPSFIEESGMEILLNDFEELTLYKEILSSTIFELFYATGIRVSELTNLLNSNINYEKQILKVVGKRNKERLIPFTPRLSRLLIKYQLARNEEIINPLDNNYLFLTQKGKKLNNKFVYNLISYYLSRVTTSTKKSPHVMRHTFATHMLNHGADLNIIKEILGHSSLAATQVYTHNTIEKLKEVYKQAHPKA